MEDDPQPKRPSLFINLGNCYVQAQHVLAIQRVTPTLGLNIASGIPETPAKGCTVTLNSGLQNVIVFADVSMDDAVSILDKWHQEVNDFNENMQAWQTRQQEQYRNALLTNAK